MREPVSAEAGARGPCPSRRERRRQDRDRLERRAFAWLTLLLTTLVLVAQGAWALTTPAFRGPDEPHHVNSILRLASGNGWPDPGEAKVDPAVMDAAREAGLITPNANGFAYVPDRYLLVESGQGKHSWYDTPVVPQPERMAIGEVAAADPAATVRDQMTQHPPAYYAAGALLAVALNLSDSPWDRTVLTLRLFSLALTAPLVPSLVYTARRLGASRRWALTAGLLPLFVPQVTFISAMTSNDAPAIGLGALAIAAMTWAATRPVDRWSVLLPGIAVGAAMWTKGQTLALGLPLLLVLLLRREAPWPTRIRAALAAGTLTQLVCPWWVMNLVRFGALQPDGFQRGPLHDTDPAEASLTSFLVKVVGDLTASFFGRFGWLDIPVPVAVTVLLAVVLTGLTVLGIVRAQRQAWIPLAFFAAVLGMSYVLVSNAWVVYVETGQVGGVQGRYLFPFLGAWAVLALGVVPFGRVGFAVWTVAAAASNAGALFLVVRTYFPGAPIDLERMSAVIGFAPAWMVLVLAWYAAAMVVLVAAGLATGAVLPSVSAGRLAGRFRPQGRTTSRPS